MYTLNYYLKLFRFCLIAKIYIKKLLFGSTIKISILVKDTTDRLLGSFHLYLLQLLYFQLLICFKIVHIDEMWWHTMHIDQIEVVSFSVCLSLLHIWK